ncbi:hypothetical protein ACFL3C_04980 [Patescibacteria group bacterium]
MKKLISILLVSVATLMLFSGCQSDKTDNGKDEQPASVQEQIEVKSKQILLAFKNNSIGYVAQHVHPNEGVRFSPYGNVDTDNDVVLSADELKSIMADSRSFSWGHYDGSGEPIENGFGAYFEEFVYDEDFLNAEKVAYDEIISTGNTVNNIETAYPDAHFVEYHFSGFAPEYEGMDWASLRLVFEEHKGEWYLVGVIHDQWTI